MSKTTLKELMEANIERRPKAMNIVLKKFAKEQGIDLTVESNYHYCENEEDEIQAIEVTKEFEQTLSLLGAKMTPTVDDLFEIGNRTNRDDMLDVTVEIKQGDMSYEGNVFENIINKTLSIWIDVNELKIKQNQ